MSTTHHYSNTSQTSGAIRRQALGDKAAPGMSMSGGGASQTSYEYLGHIQRALGNHSTAALWNAGQLQKRFGLQRQMTVGASDDPQEHEADSVARQIMTMPEPVKGAPEGEEDGAMIQRSPIQISRMCADCENEMQRESTGDAGAGPISSELESSIQTMRGTGGAPLPDSERSFFEPRFGRDFSNVRVHTGPDAAQVARQVNARAFTIGRDVVFGAGEYKPGTSDGRSLMAHELTHTVQQGAVG